MSRGGSTITIKMFGGESAFARPASPLSIANAKKSFFMNLVDLRSTLPFEGQSHLRHARLHHISFSTKVGLAPNRFCFFHTSPQQKVVITLRRDAPGTNHSSLQLNRHHTLSDFPCARCLPWFTPFRATRTKPNRLGITTVRD